MILNVILPTQQNHRITLPVGLARSSKRKAWCDIDLVVYADDVMAELIDINEELCPFIIGCYSIIRLFPRLLKHELTTSLNTLISGTGLHMPDDTKQLEVCFQIFREESSSNI